MTLRRLGVAVIVAGVLAAWSAPAASAGLLVTANDDTYVASHDQVLSVAAPGVLANDAGLLPTAAKLTNPAHGTVTVNANGAFSYHPAARYVGPDSFTYEARVLNLGVLVTDPATVTLTVTNAAPVGQDDAYVATTGVALKVGPPGVLMNDTDADGDHLQAVLVSGGGNGSLDLKADGGFTYKSGGSFVGTYTFTYRVSDGITTSAIVTVTIDVGPKTGSPPPTATPLPTPSPTPAPVPTPTPAPTPTPTVPLPTIPLPTLPLPSLTLPPILATPTPPARPTPTPAPADSGRPGSSGGVGSSQAPGPGGTTSPGAPAPDDSSPPDPSASPASSADPGSTLPPGFVGGGPGAGTVGGGSAGSASGPGAPGAPVGDGRLVVGGADAPPIDGLTDMNVVGLDGLVTWAVPSLALSVPGLLLVLAVIAQTLGATAWLPVARRWLGGFGFGRRRREGRGTIG